jgi:hypothetical protein
VRIDYIDNMGNRFEYDESFWTSGKKELSVNGVPAHKVSKKVFILPGSTINATVKGNFLAGIKLQLNTGGEIVLCKNKWYEWPLIFLPLLGIGLGIFGGALGGGLSALFGFSGAAANAVILRSKRNIVFKVLCCLVIAVGSFFIWLSIYEMMVGGLAIAFPSIFSR